MTFAASLATGRVAESAIARWLMVRGFAVLPVYEKAEQEYKGPQLFSCAGAFIAPDMLALKAGGPTLFVEAKSKSGFTWSRRYQRFETGIDLKHYLDYQAVRCQTGLPLWVLFLQKGGAVKDAPPDKPTSPRGLFGNEIGRLMARESHRHDGWGKGGMVYWSPTYPVSSPALLRLATYDDVLSAVPPSPIPAGTQADVAAPPSPAAEQ
jgi:uncharacterized protein YodC (DUF2158 family)